MIYFFGSSMDEVMISRSYMTQVRPCVVNRFLVQIEIKMQSIQ